MLKGAVIVIADRDRLPTVVTLNGPTVFDASAFVNSASPPDRASVHVTAVAAPTRVDPKLNAADVPDTVNGGMLPYGRPPLMHVAVSCRAVADGDRLIVTATPPPPASTVPVNEASVIVGS